MKIFVYIFLISWNVFSYKYSEYYINVELDPVKHKIVGEVIVNFANNFKKPINEVYFAITPNLDKKKNPYLSSIVVDSGYEKGFDPKYTDIVDVTINDVGAQYSFENGFTFYKKYSTEKSLLKIKLPKLLPPSERTKIKIKFFTKFPNKKGDEGHYKGMYLWRFNWFPHELAVIDNEWFIEGYSFAPIKYNARILIPENYQLSSGSDSSSFSVLNNKKIYTLSSENFVVSVPICISNDFTTLETTIDGITLLMHIKKEGSWLLNPPHTKEGLEVLNYAAHSINYYNKNFGRLKKRKIEFVQSNDTSTGMAADGMIIVPDLFFVYKDLISPGTMQRYMDHLIAHEIAHQYWGIGVNVDFSKTNWISESFAQYLSITYLEDKYGPYNNVFTPGAFFKYTLYNYLYANFGAPSLVSNYRKEFVEIPYRQSVLNKTDEPIEIELQHVNFGENLSTSWYKKGYLILRSMENLVGRNTFNATLTNIYETSSGLPLKTESFLQKMKFHSGRDFKNFANDWIWGSKTLDYSIDDLKTKKNNTTYSNTIIVSNKGTGTMPVDLLLFSSNNNVVAHERISVFPNKNKKIVIETEKLIERASLDEREFTPDINRKNNFFPRNSSQFGFLFDSRSTDKNYLTFDIYLANNKALELRGGYLNNYRWSTSIGHLTYDTINSFYYTNASFKKNIGREKYIYTFLSHHAWETDVSKYFYNLNFGFLLPIFTNLESGYSSKSTYPHNNISLLATYINYDKMLNHVHSDFSQTKINEQEFILSLTYTRKDILNLGLINTLSSRYYLADNSFKLKSSSIKFFKPLGRMLLTTKLDLGYCSSNIKNINSFDLDHLHVLPYKIRGNALLSGSIEIMFNLYRSRKTRILGSFEKTFLPGLNFLVFEGFNLGGYIQAADVFDPSNPKNTIQNNMVGGPKLQILQSTFLAIPFDLVVSGAFPITKKYNPVSKFFLEAGLRF